jgi:heat shock protein HslJ
MAMTQMACEQPLMDQDTWIAAFLAAGPTLDLAGETLTLTGDDATLTLTDQEVAEPDLPIDGTTWTLESIGSADAVSSVPGGVTATLVFDGAGNVAVDTSCNTGSAMVELSDTAMLLSPMALTKMACGPDETEVETTMVALLMGEVAYEVSSDVLTLTRGPNSLVFRGTPA